MLRETRIQECLKSLSMEVSLERIIDGDGGIGALEIAEHLNLDRANVSKELNLLVKKERAIKITGRPVLFFDVEVFKSKTNLLVKKFEVSSLVELNGSPEVGDDPFTKIIGCDESLAAVVKKAKAAMIYPPFGLHTLLIGATGVGKTMFAEVMYQFAKKQGVLKDNSQFVVFNCAEYADNPQLLLGQLFGYSKGSFTGADKDYEGLVAKANNGILFLDEIHRLPAEGQEMLFILMDKNKYRKLGSSQNIDANVLILAATTEDPSSNLLRTFLRRIPMTIEIPALAERTVKERLDLIEYFFRQEFSQLKLPIYVTLKTMKALIGYECGGNIGQLRADIRLLCAKAFLEYKAQNLHRVEVNTPLLSDNLYSGLVEINSGTNSQEISQLIRGDIFIYNTEAKEITDGNGNSSSVVDVYEYINSTFKKITEGDDYSFEDKQDLMIKIDSYINKLLNHLENKKIEAIDELFKVVSPRIYRAVEVVLRIAEQKLKRKIPKKAYAAMSLHISAILENNIVHAEIKEEQIGMAMDHPSEFAVARGIKQLLEQELEMVLPDQEVVFITLFLSMKEEKRKEDTRIAVLILAHGNGVAKNMAEVANTLLSTNHTYGLDMPLKQDVKSFLEIVTSKIIEINQGKGILLMVDMGSLLTFGEMITERTGIAIATMAMTSMALVLEATRKTMLADVSLEALVADLEQINPYIARYSSQEIKSKIQHKYVIICTCLTGVGAAVKLGKLLESTIPSITEHGVEVIACNLDTFKGKDLMGKKILCVVGAADLRLENIPYIATDKIFFESGIDEVRHLISTTMGVLDEKSEVNQYIARNILKESLTFLNVDKAEELLRRTFKMIEKVITIEDYNRVLINYLLHVSGMIERCIQNQTMTYLDCEDRIESAAELGNAVRTTMQIIGEEFKCHIPDCEVAYVMDIFTN